MKIVFIVFFILFIILALYFLSGKGVEFILGRAARDEDGKPRYRIKKLSQIFCLISLGLAFSAFCGFLGFLIRGASWLVYIAPVLFVIFLGAFVLNVLGIDKYKIRKRRPRPESENTDGRHQPRHYR